MSRLLKIHYLLLEHFGRQHWWPADTPFEVVVGAILTQSAAWRNVEIAIDNLKKRGVLDFDGILRIDDEELKRLIKPAGYFNAKARKLKEFVGFVDKNYDGNLDLFLSIPTEKLRSELLGIWGIGPETADSIILYAAQKPSFVVDAYTKRIFERQGLVEKNIGYDELKQLVEKHIPKDVELYNEFHALIVSLGKNFCMPDPRCVGCPLDSSCRFFNSRRE
ncbi:MAG: endonuclease [Candidatus Altiarchaeales archaeon IMC4]|nr:MAG: endonuclease [Candidatus Altiarchaeales archaeon IMC4]